MIIPGCNPELAGGVNIAVFAAERKHYGRHTFGEIGRRAIPVWNDQFPLRVDVPRCFAHIDPSQSLGEIRRLGVDGLYAHLAMAVYITVPCRRSSVSILNLRRIQRTVIIKNAGISQLVFEQLAS